MRSILSAIAVVLLLSGYATAKDTTFTQGGQTNHWSDPTNWSNGIPGPDDNAIIDAANDPTNSGNHRCLVDTDATAKYVNWTTGLMGQSGGTLAIAGNFDSSANDFYSLTGGTLQVGGAVQTRVGGLGNGTAIAAAFLNGVSLDGPNGTIRAAAGGTDVFGGVISAGTIEIAAGRSMTVHAPSNLRGGTFNVAGSLHADSFSPSNSILSGGGSYQFGTCDGNGSNLSVSGATVDFLHDATGFPIIANSGLPTQLTFHGPVALSTLTLGDGARAVFTDESAFAAFDGRPLQYSGTGNLDIGRRTINAYGGAGAELETWHAVVNGAHPVNGIPQWDGPGITSPAARAEVAAHPNDPRAGLAIGIDPYNENDSPVLIIRYSVLGDADMRGQVDFADFLIWKDAFSQNLTGEKVGGWWHAQFDYGETQTTFADFLIWKHNFGLTVADVSPLHAVPVPEPSTGVLAIVAGGIILWAGRWRRR